MGRAEREEGSAEPLPLERVVPARAVLTELARGFLMVHASDPDHATRFARSFLQEQSGSKRPERVPVAEHLTNVRRGVATALIESRLE